MLADTPPVQFDWSFVDETQRDRQTDFLFQVDVKSGGTAFIYVLFHHDSHRPDPDPDPAPALQLQIADCMIRIWQRYAQDRPERLKALPPIVPMVLVL